MARPKQQFLKKPQMKALMLKVNRPEMSNGEIAKIAGVTKESVRLWFDDPKGKTLPAQCWRRYQATGEFFEPIKYRNAAHRRQSEANTKQINELDAKRKEIEELINGGPLSWWDDSERADKIRRRAFKLASAGYDPKDDDLLETSDNDDDVVTVDPASFEVTPHTSRTELEEIRAEFRKERL